MLKHAPLFALLLLAAGCTRHDSSSLATGPDVNAVPAARAKTAGRLVSPAAALMHATVGAGHAFASLPDRGNLVGYPARPVVRRDGAYTWHRAELSEQHAIRAIATGIMRIKAPSGQELEFRYDRHEEYPNGDWSWVGHLGHGSQADDVVITFGPKAAFGTIAQPAGKVPLRLTIQNGVSWLVETDQAAIASVRNAATDPKRPDYLVPPKAAAPVQARAGGSAGVTAGAAPAMAAATAAGDPVVDLVIGYTPGFVSGLGGDSQAQTRLNNMVAITNEAYANSQVPGRVRLVKTVLVNYPDATSNDTALEQLTGFKAPSTRTTPAAAFSALRAARDQYGADLVSLVRKFNDPENDGCGIAWLNGGSSTGRGSIDSSDEFFGYSVVSDGRDAGTDGKTYFCREETLAHELGHNLGSQHDRVTATENGKVSYGLYPYSFGYKTATGAGNFYTIMAYGDRGQTTYRTFSNPRITICGGTPCGIDNQADVARSLIQAMPLVAAFRATVVADPPVQGPRWEIVGMGDMNGDGRSDIFWHNPDVGLEYWQMNGTSWVYGGARAVASRYRVAGVGDINGDGRADVIWRDEARTELWAWLSQPGGVFSAQFLRSYPAGWEIVGMGDMNGDGRSDIFWHNPDVGLEYWQMNGTSWVYGGARAVASRYRVAGVGDINGDGRADVIWRDEARTELWAWLSQPGGVFSAQFLRSYPAGWEIVGMGDMNGDGRSDIFWHNPDVGLEYWQMNGTSWVYGGARAVASRYRVAGVGDINGDGRADVIWRDEARTELWAWLSQPGGVFSAQFLRSYPR